MLEVLSNAVTQFVDADPRCLDDDALQAAVVGAFSQSDRLEAAKAGLVSEWEARKQWTDDGSKSPAHRLARDTGTSIEYAKSCVNRARKMRTMPLCTAAFKNGSISVKQFDLIARANQKDLTTAFCRDELLLLNTVQSLQFGRADKAVKYWVQCANDTLSEDKATNQLRVRTCSASTTFEGSVDLKALLDPINGEVFLKELKRIERQMFEADWAEAKLASVDGNVRAEDLARTPQQRRADALVEMARRSARLKDSNGESNNAPLISVIVDRRTFNRVCELSSGVVITPGQAASILTSADIERIVIDSEGRVTDLGRQRNFIGAARRAVKLRDRHCQHRGCDAPMDDCQVDHVVAWAAGGMTTPENGQLLCAAHNRFKGSGPP